MGEGRGLAKDRPYKLENKGREVSASEEITELLSEDAVE
jgi:hypothetical protein